MNIQVPVPKDPVSKTRNGEQRRLKHRLMPTKAGSRSDPEPLQRAFVASRWTPVPRIGLSCAACRLTMSHPSPQLFAQTAGVLQGEPHGEGAS